MRCTLLCVGRLSREYAAVYDHYAVMLRPYVSLEVVEVPEIPLSQGTQRVMAREGEAVLRRMRPGAFTVVLEREGRELSSHELSARLAELKVDGRSEFQFILGGALGLSPDVRAAADLTWSLSRLTFPHQLARCIVVEQLFRAVRIERGEPYHY
jgi:23S rRNA (pseudouridine1915-N3)-methyltransferase